jgi:hypothetical protein
MIMSVKVVDLNNEAVKEEAPKIEETNEEVVEDDDDASPEARDARDPVNEVVKTEEVNEEVKEENPKKRNLNGKHKRIEYNVRNV